MPPMRESGKTPGEDVWKHSQRHESAIQFAALTVWRTRMVK